MDQDNQKIATGKFVKLGYDLYAVENGEETLMHQTDIEDPEKIVYGVTQGVIEPLEKAIEGLAQGDTFDVLATAEQAFGPREKDNIITLEKNIFLVDGKFDSERIKAGTYVPMMTGDGFHINGLVLNVTDKDVTLDFNHPLAGKDVRFKGRILEVRDSTPEDLAGDSCGCGGCGCDGGCGGGCGENGCACQ
jgi:FKBP-type peptidyl-prolyl cis-trans isomerase SlyD